MANKTKNKNHIDSNQIERPKAETNEFEGKIAVCKMDNQISDLVKFNTFHNLHKKFIKLILSSVLVFIGGVFALTNNSTSLAIVFFVMTPVFPIALIFIQRVSLRTQLQKDFEFANTNNSYEFSEDEFFAITKCGKRVSSVKINYEKLSTCYETPTSFYIYISEGNAFVLNKDKFVYGNIKEFSEFLKAKIGKRYKATIKQKISSKRGN